jgi:hypothetical protein
MRASRFDSFFFEFPSFRFWLNLLFFDLAASSDELAALDLYGLLAALPKYNHTNASHELAKQESLAKNEGKVMSKRALARLKRKEMIEKPKLSEHPQDGQKERDGENEIGE